jgi:hypothetical protein
MTFKTFSAVYIFNRRFHSTPCGPVWPTCWQRDNLRSSVTNLTTFSAIYLLNIEFDSMLELWLFPRDGGRPLIRWVGALIRMKGRLLWDKMVLRSDGRVGIDRSPCTTCGKSWSP